VFRTAGRPVAPVTSAFVTAVPASVVAAFGFALELGKPVVLRRLLGPGREEQLFQIKIRFGRRTHAFSDQWRERNIFLTPEKMQRKHEDPLARLQALPQRLSFGRRHPEDCPWRRVSGLP